MLHHFSYAFSLYLVRIEFVAGSCQCQCNFRAPSIQLLDFLTECFCLQTRFNQDLAISDFLHFGSRAATTEAQSAQPKLRDLFGKKTMTCPMRGKMLPELCAQGVDKIWTDIAALSKAELVMRHRHALSEQWLQIIGDYLGWN